ncbi:MAG: FdtA/QdtA family cupin domain-containing protein [Flavobacteriia bacterium]|nr:FdtA/QdtA family cupin domain-containing protein [Flavobacteriia bacterium]
MAELIELKTFTDIRGSLTVIENEIPFSIKRIFYIYNVDDSVRGGHRHQKTVQAAFCIKGSCKIVNNNGFEVREYLLDSPTKCLIIQPEDWHEMCEFSKDAILMVLASENYIQEDYIYEKYE